MNYKIIDSKNNLAEICDKDIYKNKIFFRNRIDFIAFKTLLKDHNNGRFYGYFYGDTKYRIAYKEGKFSNVTKIDVSQKGCSKGLHLATLGWVSNSVSKIYLSVVLVPKGSIINDFVINEQRNFKFRVNRCFVLSILEFHCSDKLNLDIVMSKLKVAKAIKSFYNKERRCSIYSSPNIIDCRNWSTE